MARRTKIDNFLMRCWLETIQNIVGPNGLKSVLNFAHLEQYIDNFPPDNGEVEIPVEDPQALFRSLYELFGQKGSRSLSLRAGQEFARIAIEGRSAWAKALMLAARLVPETKKIRLVLEKAEEKHNVMYKNEEGEPTARLVEEKDYFLYTFEDHWESEGIKSEKSMCNFYLGFFRYLVEWITGHPHDVEEVECRARGHPVDTYRVAKARKEI